jgi:hypothetical protein
LEGNRIKYNIEACILAAIDRVGIYIHLNLVLIVLELEEGDRTWLYIGLADCFLGLDLLAPFYFIRE